MTERPRSFQSWRGLPQDEREPSEPPYSAGSYSAQYGITVEHAHELIEDANNKHGNVIQLIMAHFKAYPDERRKAIKAAEQKPERKAEAAEEYPGGAIDLSDKGDVLEVEGFTTPQRIIGEQGKESFRVTSRRLIKKYGKEMADQLVQSALNDEEFEKWLDTRLGKDDHNLVDASFHLDDVPADSHMAIRTMLANRYLESLIGE